MTALKEDHLRSKISILNVSALDTLKEEAEEHFKSNERPKSAFRRGDRSRKAIRNGSSKDLIPSSSVEKEENPWNEQATRKYSELEPTKNNLKRVSDLDEETKKRNGKYIKRSTS